MYEDVIERLEQERVRYVVVGGVALLLHGCPRPTADLDLAVDRAPEEAARAVRALLSIGFVPTLPLALAELTVLPFLDREHRPIDVFARTYVPFAELWSHSEHLRLSSGRVRVASIADLIRAKRAIGRPGDLRDVEALLAARSRLDG